MAEPTLHRYGVENLSDPDALRALAARIEERRLYTPEEAATLTGIVALVLDAALQMRINLANLAGLGGIELGQPVITREPAAERPGTET